MIVLTIDISFILFSYLVQERRRNLPEIQKLKKSPVLLVISPELDGKLAIIMTWMILIRLY